MSMWKLSNFCNNIKLLRNIDSVFRNTNYVLNFYRLVFFHIPKIFCFQRKRGVHSISILLSLIFFPDFQNIHFDQWNGQYIKKSNALRCNFDVHSSGYTSYTSSTCEYPKGFFVDAWNYGRKWCLFAKFFSHIDDRYFYVINLIFPGNIRMPIKGNFTCFFTCSVSLIQNYTVWKMYFLKSFYDHQLSRFSLTIFRYRASS